jgi:SnoaL-like domain
MTICRALLQARCRAPLRAPRAFATALIALVIFFADGCAMPDAASYPAAYHDALRTIAGSSPPTDAVARFAALYARVHEPGYDDRARQFYAPMLYFNDTLTTLHTNEQLVEHLRGMHEAGARMGIAIDDTIASGNDLYVRWTMDATFRALGAERTSRTIGISHLRFDAEGRCVLQQDFWDPALGFYRHIPALGSVIERIRRRFDPEES